MGGRVRSRTLTTAANQLTPLINPGVKWGDFYENGTQYLANTMVYDDGWIGISNKVTIDRPAPVPSGDPFLIYDQVLPQFSISAKVVIFGTRYTSAAAGQYIISYLVDMTLGNRYIAYLVTDPLGTPIFTELSNIISLQSGWVERSVFNIIVPEGATFDIVVLTDEATPTPTTFIGDWDYNTPQNFSAPASGEIVHARSAPQTIAINYLDDVGGDRETELQALTIGDLIKGAGIAWGIQGSTDQGTYMDFSVLPAVVGSPTGIQEFEFETATATPLEFGKDLDFWLGNPNVRGLFIADGAYASIVPDDSQYGVDIRVQEIIVSPDWDLIAQPRVALGGGTSVFNLQESMPTGLVDGGEINNGTLANDIELTSGVGVIIDAYTNPTGTPTSTLLSWDLINQAIVVTPTAGAVAFFTMADGGTAGPIAGTNLGVLTEYATRPSPTTNKLEIFLGVMIHNGTVWTDVSSPTVVNVTAHALEDYLNGVAGPTFIINGGEVTEAASFALDMEAGVVWEMNRNWHVDKSNPNQEAFPQDLAFDWKYTNRDFSDVGSLVTAVDATQYDNAGTVQAIGGAIKNTTIQRVYRDFADNIWVLWGQNIFDNYEEAVSQIGVDNANTEVPPLLQFSNLLGYIVAERGESDWLDEAARFVTPVEAIGSGGSIENGFIKVTTADTTPGVLDDKLIVTANLAKTVINPAGDEDLQLDLSAGVIAQLDAIIDEPPDDAITYGRKTDTTSAWEEVVPSTGGTFTGSISVETTAPTGSHVILEPSDNTSGGLLIAQAAAGDSFRTLIQNKEGGNIRLLSSAAEPSEINISGSAITVNALSNDIDFIVKDDAGNDALFVDATNGNVGLNTSTPDLPFEIEGVLPRMAFNITNLDNFGQLRFQENGTAKAVITYHASNFSTASRQENLELFNVTTNGEITFHTNGVGAGRMTVAASGGILVGAPTGGDKGGGTINVATNIFKNNTAYTNPDFVLELWVTGKIEKFKNNHRAEGYKMLSLKETKEFIFEHLRLPRIDDEPAGIFDMADIALEKIEELYKHAITADERIDDLESRLLKLEGLLNA